MANVTSDANARVAVLRELCRIYSKGDLANLDQLRATYIAILQLMPSDAIALGALERMALETGDQRLLTHVDAKAGSTATVTQVAAAHQTRLAETLELMGDSSAFETFNSALGRDPENLAAAYGLVRLAKSNSDPKLLTATAEQAFRVLDEPELAADSHVARSGAACRRGIWRSGSASIGTGPRSLPRSSRRGA